MLTWPCLNQLIFEGLVIRTTPIRELRFSRSRRKASLQRLHSTLRVCIRSQFPTCPMHCSLFAWLEWRSVYSVPLMTTTRPPTDRHKARLNPGSAILWCKILLPVSRIQNLCPGSKICVQVQLPCEIGGSCGHTVIWMPFTQSALWFKCCFIACDLT
jgi:hypothetical protein